MKVTDSNFSRIRRRNSNSRKRNKSGLIATISSISTVVLVLVTIYYAYQTHKLASITSDQMLLSAEPTLELEPSSFNQFKHGRFYFAVVNQSPVELIKVKLFSRYYTQVIDSNLREYLIRQGTIAMAPDTTLAELKGNSSDTISFNYRRSGFYPSDPNSFFSIYDGKTLRDIPLTNIDKFIHTNFVEFTVEYQRKIDGKMFSKLYYYTIFRDGDSSAVLSEDPKMEILNMTREHARQFINRLKSRN